MRSIHNCVVFGDTCEVMRYVPSNSFQLTFTSPPYYNARDYSQYKTYGDYLNFLKDVFTLVHEKTNEGRFLVVNTSPVLEPRPRRSEQSKRLPIPFDLNTILQNIGWVFIDDIIWLKPEGSVKNRNSNFNNVRKPLVYKPNNVTEYIFVYRKRTERLIDWNLRRYPDSVVEKSLVTGDYETTNVWTIPPVSDDVHSAVFPKRLCRNVIKYYSFVGDTVFDPFAGSGTVAQVARLLNRNFFLTEQQEGYFDYIRKNLSQRDIFDTNEYKFMSLDNFKERV